MVSPHVFPSRAKKNVASHKIVMVGRVAPRTILSSRGAVLLTAGRRACANGLDIALLDGLAREHHRRGIVGRGERQSFSATCCGPCTTHVCVRLCGEGVGRECVWTARLSVCMRPLCTLELPVAADADETPVLDNRTLRARGRARQQRTAKCISATPRSTRQCRL